MNKKQKQTKNNANISIVIRRAKKFHVIFSTLNCVYDVIIIKKKNMIISLNFGLIFIFKSSMKPKRKNDVQYNAYSIKKIFR